MRSTLALATLSVISVSLVAPLPGGADPLDDAMKQALRANQAAAQVQQQVEVLDDQAAAMLAEYRALQQRIESMAQYEAQVRTLVEAQRTQLAELRSQIGEATNVGREIVPLQMRMLEALGQFIELDVPFLLEERRTRLATLREMIQQPDVTDAEKFRRIIEAYQIENDYGRTIEAYRGNLQRPEDAARRVVVFLRLGRVALLYQTLDGREIGAWQQSARRWIGLGPEYRTAIAQGIRMAQKQAPPDLLVLPVPGPGDKR